MHRVDTSLVEIARGLTSAESASKHVRFEGPRRGRRCPLYGSAIHLHF